MSNVDNISRYSKRLIQQLWDPEPKNDDPSSSPIWCLGREYFVDNTADNIADNTAIESSSSPSTPSGASGSSDAHHTASQEADPSKTSKQPKSSSAQTSPHHDAGESTGWPQQFLADFESRIWMTYRTGFQPIPKSEDPQASAKMSLTVRLKSQFGSQDGFTSDTGWGCMIRSGQALLANALALLRLGRDWRRGQKVSEEKKLLALFADDPRAPFSIHRFVAHGAAACGTFPGQWFGPSATARCIEALSQRQDATELGVYVTENGPDVFAETMIKLAKRGTEKFHPTLLLIGTRLGIDRVTPAYWDALKATLRMPQSVGIAGGKPSASHYFMASQGSTLFYLDPHHPRPALPLRESPDEYTTEEVDTCHTCRLRRATLEEMDPSMLIAFLFKDEQDWQNWREAIRRIKSKAIVHVMDTAPNQDGQASGREGALDEVETLDDEDDENEQESQNHVLG